MDREALLSAARVCRERADVHSQLHAVAFEMEALRCELAILALAEQQPALPGPETVSEQRLWLWKNFVDGKPEYFVFDNPFPCYGNGDPMTFGEPVGYAILKSSTRSRNAVDDEYELARLINRNRQEKSAAKETVPVPRETAITIRRAFLPANPNKMRRADPEVVAAAREFILLAAGSAT